MPSTKHHHSLIGQNRTAATIEVSSPKISIRPEFFRLPVRGVDQHFGLTRGFYYNLEKQGLIRLIRLRQRGKQRGVTLVPYDDVKKVIQEARQ